MHIPDLSYWFCKLSKRSELLKYNTIHSTSLPVVQNNYKGFLTIMIKKALDQSHSTFRVDCLPRWGVYTLMFCTTGIEIQNKTIRGQREEMCRNQKLQLGKNLRNLASHLSSRPSTEFLPFELLWQAGQILHLWTTNSNRVPLPSSSNLPSTVVCDSPSVSCVFSIYWSSLCRFISLY